MDNRLAQPSQNISPFTASRFRTEKNSKLLISWFAGLAGGFTSATICAPMDVARTRHMLQSTTNNYGGVQYRGFLQTVRKICSEEGIRGLYKGYSVTAVSIPAFHSLYFTLFYHTKESLSEHQVFQNRNLFRDLVASIYAGVICNTVTNPLWVVRTRMQSQHIHPEMSRYTGIANGISRIYREEGFKALFKGLGASYLGLSHAIILYPLYEHLKCHVKEWKGTLNTSDIFLTSLAAKFTAMVITYPHLVIRARLQDHRAPSFVKKNRQNGAFANGFNEKATIASVVRQTLQKEGIKGLYSGLRIDLVRVLPSNSIMFVMFEFIKKDLEQRWLDEEREY